MTERELKKRIKQDAEVPIDPKRRTKALDGIERADREATCLSRPDAAEILRIQLGSLPGWFWALQLCLAGAVVTGDFLLQGKFGGDGRRFFPFLSVCLAAVALAFVQELNRHFSFRTAEVEQCCYLNLSQLWLLRLCCVGGADILAVVFFCILRADDWGYGVFPFAIYVLTPYFLANAVFLCIYCGKKREGLWPGLCIALFLGGCLGMQIWCPWIYDILWLPVWIGVLLLALACCSLRVKGICARMEEYLCLN